MYSQEFMRTETAHYRALAKQLREDYSDIDDETLADTLQGLSELPDLIEAIVRSSLEDAALITGLKSRLDDMQARIARFRVRYEKKRSLACWAMGSAGMGRFETTDFSVSLAKAGQKLDVSDEKTIPEIFFIPQPAKLDRTSLQEALKRGDVVDGACLVQGAPHIVVRAR